MSNFRVEPKPVVDTFPKTVQRKIYRLSDDGSEKDFVGWVEQEITDDSGGGTCRLCNASGGPILGEYPATLDDEDILDLAEKQWGIPERDRHGRESDKKEKGLER